MVPGQLLGPHSFEYQQRMMNTAQTSENTLLQLLLVYGDESNLKKQTINQTF